MQVYPPQNDNTLWKREGIITLMNKEYKILKWRLIYRKKQTKAWFRIVN